MKKIIRLTESDLVRIVKRVITESSYPTGTKIKIPIKKNGTYIIIKIKSVTENGSNVTYYYSVVSSTFSDMEIGYSNNLTVKNNKTYYLDSPYDLSETLQSGPISDLKKIQ